MELVINKYKIVRYPARFLNGIRIVAGQRLFSEKIKKSRREKIVFVVPSPDFISGGILSIINMYNTARELFPDKDVYFVNIKRFQKVDRWHMLDFKGKILNLNYFLKRWLHNNDRIIFHVFEYGLMSFLVFLEKKGLLHRMKNATLNILNQNQDQMPPEEKFQRFIPYFRDVTMTVAYKENEKKDFSCLTIPPIHVGAYFEGPLPEQIPYSKKKNICIFSNDSGPHQEEIRKVVTDMGIKVYDKYPIPYSDFVNLQKEAKFTISFGEGWDGYTMGQFSNGGIGFGVYQKNFQQDYFDSDSLPKFLFASYDEMLAGIKEAIEFYDDEKVMEEENKKWVEIMNESENVNTKEKVKERWKKYYTKIGEKF